jgi:hypothetical protein
MFEKDSRKVAKEKRSGEMPPSPKKDKKEDESNTVYGELKLSERLSLEMI